MSHHCFPLPVDPWSASRNASGPLPIVATTHVAAISPIFIIKKNYYNVTKGGSSGGFSGVGFNIRLGFNY